MPNTLKEETAKMAKEKARMERERRIMDRENARIEREHANRFRAHAEIPTNPNKPISSGIHKAVHYATRPEFGKYGKHLKTADDVIAYYGHGLANLIGKFEGKKKEKPEEPKFKYKSSSSPYSKTFKKDAEPQKMLTGPKPMKALPSPEKAKMLTGPKPMKALPAPPKPSTAVSRPLPMQKRLPSTEKLVGSGSTMAARTQGMPKPMKALPAPQKMMQKPMKALPAPQKMLPKLESVLLNKFIGSYKERLLESSIKKLDIEPKFCTVVRPDKSDTVKSVIKKEVINKPVFKPAKFAD